MPTKTNKLILRRRRTKLPSLAISVPQIEAGKQFYLALEACELAAQIIATRWATQSTKTKSSINPAL